MIAKHTQACSPCSAFKATCPACCSLQRKGLWRKGAQVATKGKTCWCSLIIYQQQYGKTGYRQQQAV